MDKNALIWALHDGRISSKRQVIGLAQDLDLRYSEIKLERKLPRHLPIYIQCLWLKLFRPQILRKTPPKIVIGAARSILPWLIVLKWLHGQSITTIYCMKPTWGAAYLDIIVAPEHDNLSGDNVLNTLGALHDFNPTKLQACYAKGEQLFGYQHRPLMAIFIGGSTNNYKFTVEGAKLLAAQILLIAENFNGTIFLLTSRRTGKEAEMFLQSAFSAQSQFHIFTSNSDINPYESLIGFADVFMVTNDSVSMVSEVAYTDKPVIILPLPNFQPKKKLQAFIKQMINRGRVTMFNKKTEIVPSAIEPLREAQRIAHYIRDTYI